MLFLLFDEQRLKFRFGIGTTLKWKKYYHRKKLQDMIFKYFLPSLKGARGRNVFSLDIF